MKRDLFERPFIKNKKYVTTILIVTFLSILVTPLPSHSQVAPSVSFDTGSYAYVGTPPFITVVDPDRDTTSDPDTVSVTVTSDSDAIGTTIQLTETGGSTGVFESTGPLILMNGNNLFPADSSVTVTYTNPVFNTLSDTAEIVLFDIGSSGPGFIAGFELTETGDDTGVFVGTFTLSSTGPSTSTILETVAGTNISIIGPCGKTANGLVTPNSNPAVGAIFAAIDDDITVTYESISMGDFTDTATIFTDDGCGGSGGGLVVNTVVLDVLAGAFIGAGGGGLDQTPPSLVFSRPSPTGLGLADALFGDLFAPDPFKPIQPTTNPTAPLRINDNGYSLTGYANTIKPEQVSTGQNVGLTLSFLEASSVQHVALHFVDETSDGMSDTDPMITFDNGNVIKSDPDGILGDQITFTTSKDGFHSIFNFGFSFDHPTNRHLMITVWDEKRNSANTKIFGAFSVSGQPIPREENHLVLSDLGQYIISQDGVVDIQAQSDTIPQQQAAWFYSNSIGRLDRHDMTSLHSTIDNEQARADTITDNFNLDIETFVADDEKKPYDTSKRAPQLTWSNVGHKLYDPTKTPDENKELLKQLLWQQHLKAEKTLKSLVKTNHYED